MICLHCGNKLNTQLKCSNKDCIEYDIEVLKEQMNSKGLTEGEQEINSWCTAYFVIMILSGISQILLLLLLPGLLTIVFAVHFKKNYNQGRMAEARESMIAASGCIMISLILIIGTLLYVLKASGVIA